MTHRAVGPNATVQVDLGRTSAKNYTLKMEDWLLVELNFSAYNAHHYTFRLG